VVQNFCKDGNDPSGDEKICGKIRMQITSNTMSLFNGHNCAVLT